MPPLRKTREVPSLTGGPFESLLAQFSAATLELNPSISSNEFARRLIDRGSEMLGARTAVLALPAHAEWDIAAGTGPARTWSLSARRDLAAALKACCATLRPGIHCDSANRRLGFEAAKTLGCENICVVPLRDSEDALLAVLCLGNFSREMTGVEEQLLEALASHASVALENAELFHRVEQSRKQWVGDFDAISDLIVVHDPENRVLRLNRPLADLLGMRLTEAIGRPIGDLEILGAAAGPGSCPFCRESTFGKQENIHQASERTYLISSAWIGAEAGHESRTIHVLKDITDRLEAERRYRRERDFNRNILNNTLSMILVLDTGGTIAYANRRCAESGYPEASLIGHSLAGMIPPSHRAAWAEALERTRKGLAVDNLELPLPRANGDQRQFSVSLSPMPGETGAVHSIVAVMTDVTDAADLQAKLMQTEKMAALGQLVSGVAHEVNNPLAAIVGFTDLLLENPAVPADAKEELRVILAEAERTRVIVHNLLSFARQTSPRREPLQVNAVLRQTLKLRAYDFSNHDVDVQESYADDLPIVLGDPHQLQQALLNILNNAYDAVRDTDRPGKIEVATTHTRGHLEISIRDNGPGISRPDRIFDPFFTTKDVGKGTGLGLSICYGIVRAHQGEILARNNSDGIGCTFTIQLPLPANPAEVASMESPS
jgi:PAS domain S-box-containing protein